MIDLRLRSRLPDAEAESLLGQVLTAAHYDVLLTGAATVRKPDGKPLAVYLPGALRHRTEDPEVYAVLHGLRTNVTKNRGNASGSKRVTQVNAGRIRTDAMTVPSALVGAIDPMGASRHCRLTAWTGSHLPEWETLQPLLREVGLHFKMHVPDRWQVQQAAADATQPAWVIEGTPFTTVTVNNTYPTGVHKDAGDLATGFSTLGVLRRGNYTGGQLVFPQYRVAVDMHDGDLLLMDAHEFHGNVRIRCACGKHRSKNCKDCGAERISVVSYFRTRMTGCGTPAEEMAKAIESRERQSHRA